MTKNKTKNINIFHIIYVFLLILTIILLAIMPSYSMNAFFEGLRIWATKVLPALLPFFILTKLLSYTNFIASFGKVISPITHKLYGVGGVSGYVYLMSIISGYPVGAKILSDLYSSNIINKKQAITITSFTSTSGPLFILGSVAIGLFNNHTLGLIILFSHYLGAILNGFLYRYKDNTKVLTQNYTPPSNPLNESMTSSIISIMTVGGFIAIFYMALQLMLQLNIFLPIIQGLEKINIDSQLSSAIICGLIEVTTGAINLSNIQVSLSLLAPILTFLISFGGLSIHAQAYCFLKNFNMPYKLFFLQKTTQAIISTIISIIICIVI